MCQAPALPHITCLATNNFKGGCLGLSSAHHGQPEFCQHLKKRVGKMRPTLPPRHSPPFPHVFPSDEHPEEISRRGIGISRTTSTHLCLPAWAQRDRLELLCLHAGGTKCVCPGGFNYYAGSKWNVSIFPGVSCSLPTFPLHVRLVQRRAPVNRQLVFSQRFRSSRLSVIEERCRHRS